MTKSELMLSVFTPAYNRAHTIERTYKSLCLQTSHDFQWIIVDDGSKDGTRNLVETWFSFENLFSSENEIIGKSKDANWLLIHYIYKKNGGMHTAHNAAYEHINTTLAVCIDSDDWMPANGVELIIKRWRDNGEEKYAGLIGLDCFESGTIVGTKFPEGLKCLRTYEMGKKYGVFCDKKYVYRSEVIKKYLPYKSFSGEKYGGVNYIYQVIDLDYEMLCFNDIYSVVEYQEDGLCCNSNTQYKESPKTQAYQFNILMDVVPFFSLKYKYAIQYIACSIIGKNRRLLQESSRKFITFFALPFGIAYYFYIKRSGVRTIKNL